MRISAYSGGEGSSPSRQGEERRQAFRRRHRVGDRLQGTLLRWESPGLAWVRVAGQELLAWIADGPVPGQTLWFLVKELVPEIVLQQLGQGEGASGLADHLQFYLEARRRFQHLIEGIEVRNDLSLVAREQAWVAEMATRPEAGQALARVLDCLGALNELLEPIGLGRLLYAPWLSADARDLELLPGDKDAGLALLDGGAALLPRQQPAGGEAQGHAEGVAVGQTERLMSLTLGFAHVQAGRCEARLLLRGQQGSCRVRAEFPDFGSQVQQVLAPLLSQEASWQWHVPALLPPGPPTVLAGLLRQSRAHVPARFSARV